MADAPRDAVVVPCFDEALRLPADGVRQLAARLDVLLVDDASADGTWELLQQLERDIAGVRAVQLPAHVGKAEAVRAGLRAALDGGAPVVAYFDADFAAPASELLRLVQILEDEPALEVALGSRVGLLGRQIERTHVRHYLGRVFATGASVALDLPVYDTQCGAKAFRRSPALEAALADPWRAQWAFDVELLARLLYGPHPLDRAALHEVPLWAWRDVRGSRMALKAMARSGLDLVPIAVDVRRARRRARVQSRP